MSKVVSGKHLHNVLVRMHRGKKKLWFRFQGKQTKPFDRHPDWGDVLILKTTHFLVTAREDTTTLRRGTTRSGTPFYLFKSKFMVNYAHSPNSEPFALELTYRILEPKAKESGGQDDGN
jgi:hypothetical protein